MKVEYPNFIPLFRPEDITNYALTGIEPYARETVARQYATTGAVPLVVLPGDPIVGTASTDTLTGTSGDDLIYGLGGNDTLNGLAGNDFLDGGTGVDSMSGGSGNDTYTVDNTGDIATESSGGGTDTVLSSVTHTLGSNVENLTLTGTTAINGSGNSLANTITGSSTNNTLDGGTGADTLIGGLGDDIYAVDNAGDVVTELANQGTDTVQSSIIYTLGNNVENLTLTGTDTLTGTGNELNNTITGNSADDLLNGGSGNDTLNAGLGTGRALGELTGETGNDTLIADTGANLLFGGEGDDVMTGGRGMSLLEGGPGNDTLTAGDRGSYLFGDTWIPSTVAGNDTLLGGPGDDILGGGYGNDSLAGNKGIDILEGGYGNDIYFFNRDDWSDTITENDPTPGNTDTVRTNVTPIDMVFARNANDLVMSRHNSVDRLTITDWYQGSAYQTEIFQTGNNNALLNTQIDQLIQAMAQFSANNGGITWDQAIDQKPNEVQAVLAAYWQPSGGG